MSPETNTKALLSDFQRNYRKIIAIATAIMLITITVFIVLKIESPISDPESADQLQLQLNGAHIPTLNLGHYVLWIVDNQGEYHFFKRFNFYQGELVSLDGSKLTTWQEEAPPDISKFVVTIEREGDRDEIPNSVILLQGAPSEGVASLRQELLAFDKVQGSFILASPSDGNNEVNEQSGLWFVEPSQKKASLSLPPINLGNWIWEARIQSTMGIDLLIGRFSSASGYDNFDDYSALNGDSLAYPGQDFFINLPQNMAGPVNLANGSYRVIISLEPNLADSDFTGDTVFMPVLSAEVAPGQAVHEPVQLQLIEDTIELTIQVL